MKYRTKNFNPFWKGMVIGIILGVIGITIYLQFRASSNKYPPTNDLPSCMVPCFAAYDKCRADCPDKWCKLACERPMGNCELECRLQN